MTSSGQPGKRRAASASASEVLQCTYVAASIMPSCTCARQIRHIILLAFRAASVSASDVLQCTYVAACARRMKCLFASLLLLPRVQAHTAA